MLLTRLALLAAAYQAPPERVGRPVLIDAFTASYEIDMVRYRLELHAPIVARTIIAESNYTFMGEPKPLHMHNQLTQAEISRFNIRLLFIQIPAFTLQRVLDCGRDHGWSYYIEDGHKRMCGKNEQFLIEKLSRMEMNQAILQEIRALNGTLLQDHSTNASAVEATAPALTPTLAASVTSRTLVAPPPPPEIFVYFSDADELLDPRIFTRNNTVVARFPGCLGVWQRVFQYNERCLMRGTRWIRAILARGDWLTGILLKWPEIELRMGSAHACAD